MIVGNGLIAQGLAKLTHSENDLFFASGVSNSSENDSRAFKREKDLLLKTLMEHTI
jgi:hypothetical protein